MSEVVIMQRVSGGLKQEGKNCQCTSVDHPRSVIASIL